MSSDQYPRGDAPSDADYIVEEDNPKLTNDLVLVNGSNTTVNKSTPGQIAIDVVGGAPTDADYLVGTAQAGLSNEIVVGTTPTAIRSFLSAAQSGVNTDITQLNALGSYVLGLDYHTTAGTKTASTNGMITFDAGSNVCTLNLPNHPIGILSNKVYQVNNFGTVPVTISRQGSDVLTVAGGGGTTASLLLHPKQSMVFSGIDAGAATIWACVLRTANLVRTDISTTPYTTVEGNVVHNLIGSADVVTLATLTSSSYPCQQWFHNITASPVTIQSGGGNGLYTPLGLTGTYELAQDAMVMIMSDRSGNWSIKAETLSRNSVPTFGGLILEDGIFGMSFASVSSGTLDSHTIQLISGTPVAFPAVAGATNRIYILKNTTGLDAVVNSVDGAIIQDPNTGSLVASITIPPYGSVTVQGDGSYWRALTGPPDLQSRIPLAFSSPSSGTLDTKTLQFLGGNVDLPSPSSGSSFRQIYWLKNNTGSAITVTSPDAGTIQDTNGNLVTSTTLQARQSVWMQADGSYWRTFSNGTVPVVDGGTGSASLTDEALLVGNGTGAIQSLIGASSGDVPTWNGTSWVSQPPGGLAGVVTYTTNSIFDTSNNFVISDTGTGGNLTHTLPSAASAGAGYIYFVTNKSTTATTTTLNRAGSDTIDGGTAFAIDKRNASYIIWSDGVSRWNIVAVSWGGSSSGNSSRAKQSFNLNGFTGGQNEFLTSASTGNTTEIITVAANDIPAISAASALISSGGAIINETKRSSVNVTLGTQEQCTQLIDTGGANRTVDLPATSGFSSVGKLYLIKKVDSASNTVTISPEATGTIDGLASVVLRNQYDYVLLRATGNSNVTKHWSIVSSNIPLSNSATQFFMFGHSSTVTGGTTRYMYPGSNISNASEIQIVIPRPMTITSISVKALAAPGTGNTDTYTLRKNASDTALVVSLVGTDAQETDTDAGIAFAAGDLMSVKMVADTLSTASDIMVTVAGY